jgi:hypothetical protein
MTDFNIDELTALKALAKLRGGKIAELIKELNELAKFFMNEEKKYTARIEELEAELERLKK